MSTKYKFRDQNEIYSAISGVTSTTINIATTAANQGITLALANVALFKDNTFELTVNRIPTGLKYIAEIYEYNLNDTLLLTSKSVDRDATFTLNFKPMGSGNIGLVLKSINSLSTTATTKFANFFTTVTTYTSQSITSTICNTGGDRYRFGYNGQEKTNEIAGIGNHNTALFWEYDTRLGRRWNLDPVDQISISNYSTFKNSPIAVSDVLGDDPGNCTRNSAGVLDAGELKGQTVTAKRKSSSGSTSSSGMGVNRLTHKEKKDARQMGKAFESVGGGLVREGVNDYARRKMAKNNQSAGGDGNIVDYVNYHLNLDKIAENSRIENVWKKAHDEGYSPYNPDGFGLHGSVGASGITASGGASAGVYRDANNNAGGFASTAGGPGIASPGFSASVGLDFYNYGKKDINPNQYVAGTSVCISLQLGIISFTNTQSTNLKTPLKPNGNLSVFSIDFGIIGFGYSTKIGITSYKGTKIK